MARVATRCALLCAVTTAAFVLVSGGGGVDVARADTGSPSSLTTPPVGGVAGVGGTLIAHPGTWEGTAPMSFAYLWYHCPFPLAQPFYITPNWPSCRNVGAGLRYVPSPADAQGGWVVVRVTAANAEGTAEAVSAPVPIALVPLPSGATAPPRISGVARTGETLEASEGLWPSPLQLGYLFVWWRCPASGCAAVTQREPTGKYTLTSADAGSQIKVTVIALQPNGEPLVTDASAESAPTETVVSGAPSVATPAPIAGVPTVGNALTVTRGEWRGTTPMVFTYQWQRCDSLTDDSQCADIAGAASPAYTVGNTDVRMFLRVRTTARSTAGTATAVSPRSAAVTGEYTYPEARALGLHVPPTIAEAGLPVCSSAGPAAFSTAQEAAAAATLIPETSQCAPDAESAIFVVSRGGGAHRFGAERTASARSDFQPSPPGLPPRAPCAGDAGAQGPGTYLHYHLTNGANYTGTKGVIEVPTIPSWFLTPLGDNKCDRIFNGFINVIRPGPAADPENYPNDPRVAGFLSVGFAKSSAADARGYSKDPHYQPGIFVYTELDIQPEMPDTQDCINESGSNCKVQTWYKYRLQPGGFYNFQVRSCSSTDVCAYVLFDGAWAPLVREDYFTCFMTTQKPFKCMSEANLEVHWDRNKDGPEPDENAPADGVGVNFQDVALRIGNDPNFPDRSLWGVWDTNVATTTATGMEDPFGDVQPSPYGLCDDQPYTRFRVRNRNYHPSC